MKEAAFRQAVLSRLPKALHRQPMIASGLGTAGTPDTYLDGVRDLWIEWKATPSADYFPRELKGAYLPTPLQRLWLDRRYANGGNAVCIVGFKLRGRAHGVVLDTPQLWAGPVPRETYEPMMLSSMALAAYIERRIT
jgi:hypothetical protein